MRGKICASRQVPKRRIPGGDQLVLTRLYLESLQRTVGRSGTCVYLEDSLMFQPRVVLWNIVRGSKEHSRLVQGSSPVIVRMFCPVMMCVFLAARMDDNRWHRIVRGGGDYSSDPERVGGGDGHFADAISFSLGRYYESALALPFSRFHAI